MTRRATVLPLSPRRSSARVFVVAAACLATIVGCATEPLAESPADTSVLTSERAVESDAAPQRAIIQDAADPQTAEVDADDRTVDARTLYPFTTAVVDWLVVAGDGEGTLQHRAVAVSELHGAQVAITLGERRTQYWTMAQDGVAMTATHAHADRAVSHFDPPLLIGPAELRRGEPIETTSRMTVVDESDSQRVKQRGTATRRIEWTGDVTISTADGPRRAHRIETLFRADLDLARAEERATLLVVPGLGPVHEQRVERIRVLGIVSRTTRQSLARLH